MSSLGQASGMEVFVTLRERIVLSEFKVLLIWSDWGSIDWCHSVGVGVDGKPRFVILPGDGSSDWSWAVREDIGRNVEGDTIPGCKNSSTSHVSCVRRIRNISERIVRNLDLERIENWDANAISRIPFNITELIIGDENRISLIRSRDS